MLPSSAPGGVVFNRTLSLNPSGTRANRSLWCLCRVFFNRIHRGLNSLIRFLALTSKCWQDFVDVLFLGVNRCQRRVVGRWVQNDFPTALESSTRLYISLPSTFTVPVCRLLKDTGMHYFLETTPVDHEGYCFKHPVFSSNFFLLLVKHLASDNTCGDCSFKLDWFHNLFNEWCQTCQSTTGLNSLSTQQASNKDDDIKHIQMSDLSSATPTCTAFLIVFEYIIFSTCRLTIS